jgi:hypothetical protein
VIAGVALGIEVHAPVALMLLPLALTSVALGLLVARPLSVSAAVFAVAAAVAVARPDASLEVVGVANLTAQLLAART